MFIISYNHTTVEVLRHLGENLMQGHLEQVSEGFEWILNIYRDGDSTASLGNFARVWAPSQ